MSDECFFLDTNILLYTFDSSAPEKRRVADALVERALERGTGRVSYQVIQEFLNVALRRFARVPSAFDADRYLMTTLLPLWKVSPSAELWQAALALHARYQYSFYDSLIIAAALEANCETLYSEDLHHGQRIESLTIENPFQGG